MGIINVSIELLYVLSTMSLSKLQEIVKDRDAYGAAVHGIAESNMTEHLNDEQQEVTY